MAFLKVPGMIHFTWTLVQLTFCQISPGQGKLCEMHLAPSDDFAFCSHAGWRSRYRPARINHFGMVGRTILCADHTEVHLSLIWHFLKYRGLIHFTWTSVQLTFCQISPGQGKLCEMRLAPSDDFAFCSRAGWRSRYRPARINHFGMVGRTILCADHTEVHLSLIWHFLKYRGMIHFTWTSVQLTFCHISLVCNGPIFQTKI